MASESNEADASTRVREHTTGWEPITTERLSRPDFIKLLTGRTGAIHVRQFISPQLAQEAVRSSERIELTMYNPEVIWPRVYKTGVALFDYYDDQQISNDYWAAARDADADRRLAFENCGDVLYWCIDHLQGAWRGPVRLASVDGNELFAGMRREFAEGARYHFDDVNMEFPEVLDNEVIHQIGFNVYLEMPSAGGGLSVAQHPYHPRDEQYRDGYGYTDAVVSGDALATITPEAGDAVLFLTKNLHSVEPVKGTGRRISFSFFIGVDAAGGLVIWS